MSLKISPITKTQAKSILKAVIYAFCAGFVGSLTLQASDFITAAHSGRSAVVALLTSVIVGALVGGINGAGFAIEKLFTQDTTGV